MDLLSFLIEVLGVVLPGILTFLVSKLYPLGQLPFLSSIPKEQHGKIIVAIPMVVYLIGRVYFGMMYFVLSKLPSSIPYKSSIDRLLSTITIITAFVIPFVHPAIYNTALTLYNDNLADLLTVVVDTSKPEIEKAQAFAYKIVLLLFGWFVLLFIIELLLRVVLWLVRVVITAVVGKPKTVKNVEEDKVKSE